MPSPVRREAPEGNAYGGGLDASNVTLVIDTATVNGNSTHGGAGARAAQGDSAIPAATGVI